MAYSKNRRLSDLISADGTLGSAKILDASIASADIADDAITAGKIADNIALPGNITTSGTLAPVGVLTANAGIVVDNITIDGTEIDLSSGDLTIDVAADMIIDVAGGDVRFKGSSGSPSATIGTLSMIDDNFTIASSRTDYDLVFKGNDGGSVITALTLDMSNAGRATFNENVIVTGDLTVSGTTTTVNTTNTTVSDRLLELGTGTSGTPAHDMGLVFERGSSDNVFVGWDESNDRIIVGTGSFTGSSTGDLSITRASFAAGAGDFSSISSSGNISGAAGSASAPSITFAADPNTGIYNSAADNLGFAIGGVAKGFWSATQFNVTGNIVASGTLTGTIGTAAQTNITSVGTLSSLAVSGVTTLSDHISIPATKRFYLDGSGDTFIEETIANTITITTGNSERMRIASAGNVGIGNTNPAEFDDLADQLVLGNGSGSTGITIYTGNSSGNTGNIFFADGNSGSDRSAGRIRYDQNTNAMSFGTAATNDRVVIDSSGNVGIGTTPDVMLHVQKGGEPAASGLMILEANSGSRQIRIAPPSNAANGYIDYRGGNLLFLDDGTEVARFQGSTAFSVSNKIGIGTSSPGAVLDVLQPSSGAAAIFRTNESTASHQAGGGFSSFGSSTAANRIAHLWLDADGANFGGSDYFYIHKKGDGGEAALIQQNNADMWFGTSGTKRITIAGGGNVGINVADPDSKLEIKGAGGTTGLTLKTTDSSSNEVFYVQDGGRVGLNYWPLTIGIPSGTSAASNTRFQVEEAGLFTVLSTGNVGVGTTAPDTPLHIQTNDSTTNALVNSLMITNLSTGTTTTGFGGEIRFQGERNNGVNQNTGRIASVAEVNSGSNISSGLSFWTGSVGVLNERMRISHGGDIGINTNAPQSFGSNQPTIELKGNSGSSRGGTISFASGTGTDGYSSIYADAGNLNLYLGATNYASLTHKYRFNHTGLIDGSDGKGQTNFQKGNTQYYTTHNDKSSSTATRAGYYGSDIANNYVGIFRTPVVYSTSGSVDTHILSTYSSNHWGSMCAYDIDIYTLYYYPMHVKFYVRQYGPTVMIRNYELHSQVNNANDMPYIKSYNASNTKEFKYDTSDWSNGSYTDDTGYDHSGQNMYRNKIIMSTGRSYAYSYAVVKIIDCVGNNRVMSSGTSESSADSYFNNGGGFHFKTISESEMKNPYCPLNVE